MADARVHALVADLLGYDPDGDSLRPSVAEAAARLGRAEVAAARGPDGDALAVYATLDGAIYAVEDRCPHDGGPLSDGFVDGRRLVCGRHGWEFDVQTGECAHKGVAICPRRVAQVRDS